MVMGVRIHITDTLIHIGTVPVGIGTTDIGPTIHVRSAERDSITGADPGSISLRAGGSKSRRHYFFGDAEAAVGADVDAPDADGSENSFFNRSCIAGNSC
jgi:hypothetical protein